MNRAVSSAKFTFHLRPLAKVRPDVYSVPSATGWDPTKFRRIVRDRKLNEQETFQTFLSNDKQQLEDLVNKVCKQHNVQEFKPLDQSKLKVCTQICQELDVHIPSFALGSFTNASTLSQYLQEQREQLSHLIDSRNIAYPDNVSFE